MPWLLLIIKHILPISELYSSFRRTDLTTGDILVASVGVHGLCFGHHSVGNVPELQRGSD